jgi:hypothetical protein
MDGWAFKSHLVKRVRSEWVVDFFVVFDLRDWNV